MRLRHESEYKTWKMNNNNALGDYIVRFADRWMELMESRIEKGEQVQDIASKTMKLADTDGLTEAMKFSAISIVTLCWAYGDDLREWFKKETEGEEEEEDATEAQWGSSFRPVWLRS